MITYNHEQFIEQAIKGVVNQKTTYPFELIIGEDASTDNTRAICKQWAEKFPTIIKLLPGKKRLGMMPNFLRTLDACKGKYIALCDGDDYWIDPGKLQEQIIFLETNPDYALCCHRIYIKKDGKKPKLDEKDIYMPATEATYTIEMMAKHGNLVASPSVVYRNNLFPSFPAWFNQSPIGDYVLHMLNARFGKIKYFPEPMAVYRDHAKGAWGGRSIKDNAAVMMKVLEFLLTESFTEPVKKGLREQLLEQKAIYLGELAREDWDLFNKEFNAMMKEDGSIAVALEEKIKKDGEVVRSSRVYQVIDKIKRLTKGTD
jgi:glycosyltransferase involved in cell wall biosynthesis